MPFRSTDYSAGVQVLAGTSGIKNKKKYKGIAVDSNDSYKLKFNKNGTIVTLAEQGAAPIASGGTARTLLAVDSGSINLFDSAAGITYTLPAPVAGLRFLFRWTVLQTSSAHVVVTNAGSVFLLGTVNMFSGADVTPSATLGPKSFAGNGSTHIKTTTNGTTTGGGIGSWLDFLCISATQWLVIGNINSPSGSIATPFST